MTPQVTPNAGDRSARSSHALHGRWLAAARIAWLTVATLAVGLSVVGVPSLYGEFRTLSVYEAGVRDSVRDNLVRLGLSVDFYAAYLLAIGALLTVACYAVAALIFWRRSDEPMALFVAMLLVLLGATFSGSLEAMGGLGPIWRWFGIVLSAVSLASVFLFFYLFPDGRFVPRWTRWLAVIIVAYVVGFTGLFPNSSLLSSDSAALPYALLLASWLLTGVFAQIYRYRRVSGPTQRQQTKWVVFGFAAALTGYLAVILAQVIFPALEPGTLPDFLFSAVAVCFMLLIPLSMGFAIMHYRLYDIDFIVNRTLVYGALTAMLGLVFFGGVTVLQAALRMLTGQGSQLAVVASTLAIAAVFEPLRRRIQHVVERHFYRRRYDAAKTLRSFGAKLRDETDLDALSDDLVEVVRETMQPAHVSLWLRPDPTLKRDGESEGLRG
jgi:hypothetical protein